MPHPRGRECGRCSEQVGCLDCGEKPMGFFYYFLFLIRTVVACLLRLSQVCPSCRPKNWPGNWHHGKVVLQ